MPDIPPIEYEPRDLIPARIIYDPPPGTKTHPYLSIIPMMTEEEFACLVWSIKKHGLLMPIAVDEEGVILDGRCRRMACVVAGAKPKFKTHRDRDPLRFIVGMNLNRYHHSPSQMAMVHALEAAEYPDYPVKPMPEAVVVAQHEDLKAAVLYGKLDLSSALRLAMQRQKAAERAYPAAQVDEERLTLDQAEEEAATPLLAEHAEAIRAAGKRMIEDAIEIGRRLTECKAMLRHGGWLPWLDREFGWSEMTAVRFMQIYEFGKSNNLLDFNLPLSGLYLLARPSTPEAVREDVLERAKAGERLSVAEIKQAIGIRSSKPTSRTQALRDLIERMTEADDPFADELRRILGREAVS